MLLGGGDVLDEVRAGKRCRRDMQSLPIDVLLGQDGNSSPLTRTGKGLPSL